MNNLIVKEKNHSYYFLGTDRNNNDYYLEDISLKSNNYYINHIKEHFDDYDFWIDDKNLVLTKNKNVDWFISLKNYYLSKEDKRKIYELCNTMQVLVNFANTTSCGYSGFESIEEEKKQLLEIEYSKKTN